MARAKVSDGVKNDINDENNSYHYGVDILWWHIAQLCIPGCSVKRFKYLIKLAELVLVMPHSNAELVSEKKQNFRTFFLKTRWDIVKYFGSKNYLS